VPYKPFVRTLRAQWLGQQMRRLREQRGMTLKMAAEYLSRDMSALARYERAEWPIRRDDVIALLDLYGIHNAAERARLLALAQEVWRTDRWTDDDGEVVDASFIDFPWLGSRAEAICSYHAMLVPGLFQLREYAELVIRSVEGPRAAGDLVTRWVELRMQRQALLDEPGRTRIETVIDEAALRRQIGGRALLRAQLARVRDLLDRPHIEVRVLPARIPLHSGLDGSFWLFRMPQPYPEVGYLENLAGHMYFELPRAARFLDAYARVRDAALDPRESAEVIAAIAEELS
jgi:transcriptional regulator with XRE-family HTH domain